jgi:hypothetical protein
MKLSSEDLSELGLRRLPSKVEDLLDQLNSPPRLVAHLALVHDVAAEVLAFLSSSWPSLPIETERVLIGAATHDIGKTRHPEELDAAGNQHEAAGRTLLRECGWDESLARFAVTHAEWQGADAVLEDRLVALADAVWKGKRVEKLEERIAAEIADCLRLSLWDVLPPLQEHLDEIASRSAQRIEWQRKFPSMRTSCG